MKEYHPKRKNAITKAVKTIAVLLSILLLAACGGTAPSSQAVSGQPAPSSGSAPQAGGGEPVRFAFSGPMTGDYAEYGLNFSTAIQVAVDEINAAGGVLGGRMLEFDVYDDKNSSEEVGAIAEMIASDPNYCAVLGHFSSGVGMTAGPIYAEAQIPLLSASASHPDFSSTSEYMFRNCDLTHLEIQNQLQVALSNGAKNIGVLCLKNDWGQSARAALEVAVGQLEEVGADINLVGIEEFIDGSDDFSAIITKFDNAGCDGIIMLCMYAAFAPFAQQYKAINPDIMLVGGGNAYSQELINLGGDAVNGTRLVATFNPNTTDPRTVAYIEAYRAVLNKEPEALASQSYDNVYILAQAIERAGSTDGAAIKDALYKTEYQGVTGYTVFSEIGDAQKTQVAFIIENGAFVEAPKLVLWDEYLKSF